MKFIAEAIGSSVLTSAGSVVGEAIGGLIGKRINPEHFKTDSDDESTESDFHRSG